jgi:DNA repair exonuclease SbcCD ATPase subunit
MTATAEVNYAILSTIEQRRLAQENVGNAEDAARIVAAPETEVANAKVADVAKIDEQLADGRRRQVSLHSQSDDARRERGEVLADGGSTTAIDKRIAAFRRELDGIEDELAALETRRNAAQKEALVPKWHSIRERSTAINGCLKKAKAHAADLKGQLDVALLTTELLKVTSQNYAVASDRAYQAILDHKIQNPHLYPTES